MPHDRARGPRAAVGVLVLLASAAPGFTQPSVTVSVDVSANRRAIDPRIYGVHFADTPTLLDLNATINRHGGNSSGRYNWAQNIDNRGGDYFFESIPYAAPVTGGEFMDGFIQRTKNGGAEPFLTMPMVGSVAKTNGNRDTLWSFSVADCGAQSASDFDAGNGCVAGAKLEFTDPCPPGSRKMMPPYAPTCDPVNAASVAADHTFQQGWVQHVRNTWGPASTSGVKYWGTDNEPTIWHNVYWDVHRAGATTAEVRDKWLAYGDMIKGVDPGVQILGPEEWGWDALFYSGQDQQLLGQGLCGGPDCPDHLQYGDYVPYLIDQMRLHEQAGSPRVLDVLSMHFYPQGGEYSGDVSPAMQLLRNRSTRGLWDPAYVNESYINAVVQLIPRMRGLASAYPGTQVGLTEYNWGAETHINGGTAQADVMGILGREGADMAIRWEVPPPGTPVYNAFKMYRNYDGAKSAFGDTSVSAAVPNPDELAAFAAQRTSTSALTVMVINKVATTTTTTVSLSNFVPAATAQRWELTAANVITQLADVPVGAASFTATLPGQSITLFVVAPGPPPAPANLSIDDVTVTEGTGGATTATFTVTRSGDTSGTSSVAYTTTDATAVAGSDYTATSGTLSFGPAVTTRTIDVGVSPDAVDEPNERFHVDLSAPVNATITRSRGTGTIVDDDGGVIALAELTRGRTEVHDFGGSNAHLYLLDQEPYASYEVMLDGVFGNAAGGLDPRIERLAADASTVLQTGDMPGPAAARSLRWENDSAQSQDGQYVRVRSDACVPCTAGDGYRVRAYDTTYSIPRFNNSGSQLTVVMVQNRSAQTVTGHLRFWSQAGALLYSQAFTVASRGLFALNTSSVPQLSGVGGSITIAHDGGYGALAGKAVALEAATGFSFDSPMQPR